MTSRVVVTGIGLVTPIGIGVDSFWEGILEGRSGLSLIDRFDRSPFRCKVAGQIRDFDAGRYVHRQDLATMDRSAHFAIAAIDLAMKDAGLAGPDLDCYCGIAVGGAESGEKGFLRHASDPDDALKQLLCGNSPNGLLVHVLREFDFNGRTLLVSNGCTTGTDVVGMAFRALKLGLATHACCLAGGAEAPITPITTCAFDNIRALSPHQDHPIQAASRPFDRDRDGFVAGEGAGFLVLEEREHALARGARVYAELVGYGASADANHMTQPRADGHYSSQALLKAIQEAGIEPASIDYVNAHGSSTQLNDKTETGMLKQVFGVHAKALLVSSTKSQVGHMLGAAGSVELAATILGVYHGYAPPTINYRTPDPDCDLNYVPNQAVKHAIRYALSNSLGFGGLNSAIVVKRDD